MSHEDSVWSEASDGTSGASVHSANRVGSIASSGSRGSIAAGPRSLTRATGGLLDHAGADMHCCTFRIGGQLFGLDVDSVGEVFQVEDVVPVPLAPAGVLGLTNLRGAALAVIDLAAILGLEVASDGVAKDGKGPALVLRLQGMRLAATIEQVESVFPVHSDSIRESDAVGEHPAIAGFLTLASEQVVSVLDVEELTERLHRLRLRQANDANGGEGLSDES